MIFEENVVMGVFTHTTQYLPMLLDSVREQVPNVTMIVKINDGPINKNMEMLRQDFLATKKRYWVFLDHDIRFLEPDVINRAVSDMIRENFAMMSVYSTYNPYYKFGQDKLECKEVTWMPGYFMMVDSHVLGDLMPDLNLPDPNTAIDTSYSIGARLRGVRIGISPSVVYHVWKHNPGNPEVIEKTNKYLYDKFGQFYFDSFGAYPGII